MTEDTKVKFCVPGCCRILGHHRPIPTGDPVMAHVIMAALLVVAILVLYHGQ